MDDQFRVDTFEDGSQALIRDSPDHPMTISLDNPDGGLFAVVKSEPVTIDTHDEWVALNQKIQTHDIVVDETGQAEAVPKD